MSQRRAKLERRGHEEGDPERIHARDSFGPIISFVLFAVVVLSAAAHLLKPAIVGRERPAPDAEILDVAADMAGFDKPVITVPAGKSVTIRLTSLDNQFHTDGGGRHQFAIDELGVDIIAPSLGSASATFTPTEPGRYVFDCGICCGGRANPSMNGTLIVTEA